MLYMVDVPERAFLFLREVDWGFAEKGYAGRVWEMGKKGKLQLGCDT